MRFSQRGARSRAGLVAALATACCVSAPFPAAASAADDAEAAVAALDAFRAELSVPGAAVAYIENCQVAWVRGLGRESIWGGPPVTPDTRFEGASLGKPVSALAMLHWAGRQGLAIDEPLGDLSLEPQTWARKVTLSHLLSHSAGLSNRLFPLDHEIRAVPGSVFRYSGVGFEIAQQEMSRRAGMTAEGLAQREVLGPLQMRNSSFATGGPSGASAHASLGRLLTISGPLLGLAFALLVFAGVVIRRLREGSWTVGVTTLASSFAVAVIAASAILGQGLGWRAAWWVSVAAILPFLAALCAFFLARPRAARGAGYRLRVFAAALVVVLGVAALRLQVPLGSQPSPDVHYAYTFRTTAHDLGQFVAALVAPPDTIKEAVQKMSTPVSALAREEQWGRGLGVRDVPGVGRVLWQWGRNVGFEGLIVAVPARCSGIAVLTNSDRGSALAARAARDLLGLEGPWRVEDDFRQGWP